MRTIRPLQAILLAALLPALGGCVARAAADVVTAPVKVVSKGVDWTTTSQSEADRNRGRDLRKREERLGSLDRSYRNHSAQCERGDRNACAKAEAEYAEIQDLRPTVPAR
jgi:hypothetical protein